MTPRGEYKTLLRQLPKHLTPDELARFKTTGFTFPSERQMMVSTGAVCRGGWWHGVVVFIHSLGVVGHQVFPQPRQHKADARAIAEKWIEKVMDYHEEQTGVRNRGMVAEEDDDSEPCPPK